MKLLSTFSANATRATLAACRELCGVSRTANSRPWTWRLDSTTSESRKAVDWSASRGRDSHSTAFGSTIRIAWRFGGSTALPTRSISKTITARAPNWTRPGFPPGEMRLDDEFLKPAGLRQTDAAHRLGIFASRLNEVVLGKRRITADTALRLSRLLKTSPQFWTRPQAYWDLHRATDPSTSRIVSM